MNTLRQWRKGLVQAAAQFSSRQMSSSMNRWYCEVGIQVWRREMLVRAAQRLFGARRTRSCVRTWAASLHLKDVLSRKRSAANVHWRDRTLKQLMTIWQKETDISRALMQKHMKVVCRITRGRQGAAFNRWQEHVLEVARQQSIIRKVTLRWRYAAGACMRASGPRADVMDPDR